MPAPAVWDINPRRVRPRIGGQAFGTRYLGKEAEGLATGQSAHDVLVVDDEISSRTVTARMLMLEGFRVHEAASGKEALQYLEAHPETHLAVIDIVMPEMDGVTLATRLGDVAPECRVILMTGYTPSQVGLGTLIDRFALLLKPFSQTELMAKVKRALGIGDH